jgi:hypothetical protein
MLNKGLCSTCISGVSCTFPRKFPVVQCEEFDDYEPHVKKAEQPKHKKAISSDAMTQEE